MEKQLFVKTINFIKKSNENIEKVDYALHQISRDFCDLSGIFFDYNETIISLLESLVPEDKADYISWWIYSTNYGESNAKIYDKRQKVIANLKTADDLYDYIFKNNKNKNNFKTKNKSKKEETPFYNEEERKTIHNYFSNILKEIIYGKI